MVVPLQEQHMGVFGVLGVDSLVRKTELGVKTETADNCSIPVVFTHHEIDFYQVR